MSGRKKKNRVNNAGEIFSVLYFPIIVVKFWKRKEYVKDLILIRDMVQD